ncbi:MAG: hypothetical protein ACFFC3_14765 [Candidatus Odinarchaeota archaeon]
MGKGSGIGILALLIAVGALGFGIFTYLSIPPDIDSDSSSAVKRTYTDFREDDFTTANYDYPEIIGHINIEFEVEEGEAVYFLFTCRAFLDTWHPTGQNWMEFWLNIDDIRYDETYLRVGSYETETTSFDLSVALQYAEYSLATGTHNVTVETVRYCDGELSNCFLLVQCLVSTDYEAIVMPIHS